VFVGNIVGEIINSLLMYTSPFGSCKLLPAIELAGNISSKIFPIDALVTIFVEYRKYDADAIRRMRNTRR